MPLTDPGNLPPSEIQTDQSPFPFWALERWVRLLIAFLIQNFVGAGASTLVWRPGGVTAGNVYATWAEVVAVVATLNGDVTIGLDTDLAAANIPAGNYDLRPAGISGQVTIVNASKIRPFTASPFITLVGAVTIKGLSGLDDASILNGSTVPVMTFAANDTFDLRRNATIFQNPGAAAFITITGGNLDLAMHDFSSFIALGGTGAIHAIAPGHITLLISDVAIFDQDLLVALAGTADIFVTSTTLNNFFSQAGAPAIIPFYIAKRGTASIVVGTGKTAAIPAFVSASSRIFVNVKTPANDANTKGYAALGVDRVVGAPGSFQITALIVGGAAGAVNGADTSDVEWEIINN